MWWRDWSETKPQGDPILVYYSTTIRLYCYTAIKLYDNTAILLYGYTAIRLYDYTAIRPYEYTAIRLYGCTTIRQYDNTVIRQHDNTVYGYTAILLTNMRCYLVGATDECVSSVRQRTEGSVGNEAAGRRARCREEQGGDRTAEGEA